MPLNEEQTKSTLSNHRNNAENPTQVHLKFIIIRYLFHYHFILFHSISSSCFHFLFLSLSAHFHLFIYPPVQIQLKKGERKRTKISQIKWVKVEVVLCARACEWACTKLECKQIRDYTYTCHTKWHKTHTCKQTFVRWHPNDVSASVVLFALVSLPLK